MDRSGLTISAPLKRLNIIQYAIALGDEDVVALQAARLPPAMRELADYLAAQQYADTDKENDKPPLARRPRPPPGNTVLLPRKHGASDGLIKILVRKPSFFVSGW